MLKTLHVLNGTLYKIIKKYNLFIKRITSDNRFKFKALGLFGFQTGIDFYKCNRCVSHERGSNENTNGLIRRGCPKKKYFNNESNEGIGMLIDNINNTKK